MPAYLRRAPIGQGGEDDGDGDQEKASHCESMIPTLTSLPICTTDFEGEEVVSSDAIANESCHRWSATLEGCQERPEPTGVHAFRAKPVGAKTKWHSATFSPTIYTQL